MVFKISDKVRESPVRLFMIKPVLLEFVPIRLELLLLKLFATMN